MNSQEIIEVMEPELDDSTQSWYSHSDLSLLKDGYDIDRFVNHPRKDFQCPICLGIVRNPLECSQCGILICRKCACQSSKQQNPFYSLSNPIPKFNCPICRSRALPREPSAILKKILDSLMVYCKNKSQSCPEIFPLGEIKNHHKECKFKAIRCANHSFCDKQGNKTDFLVVDFPNYGRKNKVLKSKLVCSEICKRVVLMDHMLKSDKNDEAINEYRSAIEALYVNI